jgi:hypothetical protein
MAAFEAFLVKTKKEQTLTDTEMTSLFKEILGESIKNRLTIAKKAGTTGATVRRRDIEFGLRYEVWFNDNDSEVLSDVEKEGFKRVHARLGEDKKKNKRAAWAVVKAAEQKKGKETTYGKYTELVEHILQRIANNDISPSGSDSESGVAKKKRALSAYNYFVKNGGGRSDWTPLKEKAAAGDKKAKATVEKYTKMAAAAKEEQDATTSGSESDSESEAKKVVKPTKPTKPTKKVTIVEPEDEDEKESEDEKEDDEKEDDEKEDEKNDKVEKEVEAKDSDDESEAESEDSDDESDDESEDSDDESEDEDDESDDDDDDIMGLLNE